MRGLRKGEKESIAKYSLGLRRYYAAAAAWCLRSVRPYTDQTTANTDTDEGAETDSCLVAMELWSVVFIKLTIQVFPHQLL